MPDPEERSRDELIVLVARLTARISGLTFQISKKYLIVACTELFSHYLLGDRTLDTFKESVLADLTGHIIVHDRYRNYDSAELGPLRHQLCTQHLLRDLRSAAETYPGEHWPIQIADAIRALIQEANTARGQHLDAIADTVKNRQIELFHHGVLVGLSATTSHGDRPGENKARSLPEVLRCRRREGRTTRDVRLPIAPPAAPARPSRAAPPRSGCRPNRPSRSLRGTCRPRSRHRREGRDQLGEHVRRHGRPWCADPGSGRSPSVS